MKTLKRKNLSDEEKSKMRVINALESIAESHARRDARDEKMQAVLVAYLRSPLIGLILSTELHGEIAEHAVNLRKQIISILNS